MPNFHKSNLSSFQNGDTPLHIAAAMGRRKLVRIILESSPDTKILNQQKESSIDIAGRKSHQDIQEIIRNPPPEIAKAAAAAAAGKKGAAPGSAPCNGGVEVVDAAEFDLMESRHRHQQGQGDNKLGEARKSGRGKHKKDKRSTVTIDIIVLF